jgi:hypothetical protein
MSRTDPTCIQEAPVNDAEARSHARPAIYWPLILTAAAWIAVNMRPISERVVRWILF